MQNPSYTNQRETLHNYLRRHGLEGDASFQALAFHYVVSLPQCLNISSADTQRWQAAHDKIKRDGLVSDLLNDVVRQDPSGANLPEWYQFFVGRRFREGSGKFFTPRPVAAAMTRLLPRRDQAVIMDPTCGGGTFLIEAARKWHDLDCTLIANDVEKSLIELAIISLSLSAPDHQKVYSSANIYDESSKLAKWYGGVDYILANPPFSLRIEHEEFDSPLFSLGYRNSDALFLDLAHALLRPGGRLVCLLPHSLVVNREFAALRDSVEHSWTLMGVICLPEGIFHLNAGTTTRADIVILDKRLASGTSTCLFASVPSVGVRLNAASKGAVTNDLDRLLDTEEVQQVLGIREDTHG